MIHQHAKFGYKKFRSYHLDKPNWNFEHFTWPWSQRSHIFTEYFGCGDVSLNRICLLKNHCSEDLIEARILIVSAITLTFWLPRVFFAQCPPRNKKTQQNLREWCGQLLFTILSNEHDCHHFWTFQFLFTLIRRVKYWRRKRKLDLVWNTCEKE